jgi:hypothetical protein
MTIYFNPSSLKNLALKKYELKEKDILFLIATIAKSLLSLNAEEKLLNNSKIKTLSEIIFYKDDSDINFFFKTIFKQELKFLFFESLLSLDDCRFNNKKIIFLDLILENIKSIIPDFLIHSMLKFKQIELQRQLSYLKEDKEKIFTRKAPLLGINTSTKNINHLEALLFLDDEILKISKIISSKRIFENVAMLVFIKLSENNKIVLQQAALKSCGQTCVCMMLLDLNLSAPLNLINEGETSKIQCLEQLLIKNSAVSKITRISTADPDEFLFILKKKILSNGSCILSIQGLNDGRIGGHFIIVDEISDDLNKIRIRDPFHGWEIIIKKIAFLDSVHDIYNKIYFTEILQIIT